MKISPFSWLIAALVPCALAAQAVPPPTPAKLIARALAAQKSQDDRGWK